MPDYDAYGNKGYYRSHVPHDKVGIAACGSRWSPSAATERADVDSRSASAHGPKPADVPAVQLGRPARAISHGHSRRSYTRAAHSGRTQNAGERQLLAQSSKPA